MFTIKQVVRVRGPVEGTGPGWHDEIRLWEASEVALEKVDGAQQPNVRFDLADGSLCYLDSGVVYVMNEAGRTVETFRFPGSESY